MARTTAGRRSVPTCGRASQRISSGAPKRASVSSTSRQCGVLDAGIELAIGKRARAAFAELHVAFRVERAAVPEGVHVPGALVHALAALHHQRGKARRAQASGPRTAPPGRGRPPADDAQGRAARAAGALCGAETRSQPLGSELSGRFVSTSSVSTKRMSPLSRASTERLRRWTAAYVRPGRSEAPSRHARRGAYFRNPAAV